MNDYKIEYINPHDAQYYINLYNSKENGFATTEILNVEELMNKYGWMPFADSQEYHAKMLALEKKMFENMLLSNEAYIHFSENETRLLDFNEITELKINSMNLEFAERLRTSLGHQISDIINQDGDEKTDGEIIDEIVELLVKLDIYKDREI